MPGVAACLTNGEMFYDAGRVHAFAADPPASLRPPVKGVRLVNESIARGHPTVASWWNVGLFSGYDREGVVLGYLESTHALGLVLVARTGDGEVAFLGESVHAPPVVLRPGRSIGSNRFTLNVAATPYAALEQHADAVGTAQSARTRSIVNGWCSWFYTLDQGLRGRGRAEHRIRGASTSARSGSSTSRSTTATSGSHGDWEGNERFPHGMKWLAERIKAHGFKPGLWIAPYVISEQQRRVPAAPRMARAPPRRLAATHRQLGQRELARQRSREVVKRYCLDVTHPEAADWLRDLFETIASPLGLRDDQDRLRGLVDPRGGALPRSDAVVRRGLSARALEIMRAAVGDECHILDCGPGQHDGGSHRQHARRGRHQLRLCGGARGSSISKTRRAARRRPRSATTFTGRTWVNDVDHVCIDLLTVEQARRGRDDRRAVAAAT